LGEGGWATASFGAGAPRGQEGLPFTHYITAAGGLRPDRRLSTASAGWPQTFTLDRMTAVMGSLVQTPRPGEHLLRSCGDTAKFTLKLSQPAQGAGWLRTNVGRAALRRREIIDQVENEVPVRAGDWYDIRMHRGGPATFTAELPLTEVGCFQAKAFFMPENEVDPVWPDGENVTVKVEPAGRCCANTIYTAFVRQFGPDCEQPTATDDVRTSERLLAENDYTVIPRSGSFRELIRRLDFIIGELGFRIIQLLPIHPVPTTYARMGRFGSPYAVLDFLSVDPALAEFDRQTTPLDQFRELVDAVHCRNASILIDIPINHTGWASALQIQHPEWFARNADRTFRSPGAWGVTWEDLSQLDYRHRELWTYMADVFLYWCRQGVDGFRCDAGYMIPTPVWQYIVAKVRNEFPETLFLLEGLGGKTEVMQQLLTEAGLDWAYSELFQNYDRSQVSAYLQHCIRLSETEGNLVHFAETHDNNRLASRSHTYARLRTALSAMCSHAGAFGVTNGVEWLAKEKLDVHGATTLNWGAEPNLAAHIARLTTILETHPAFHAAARLRLIASEAGNSIALLRSARGRGRDVLVLANLHETEPDRINWSEADWDAASGPVRDLISDEAVPIKTSRGRHSCHLTPGHVLCLSKSEADRQTVAASPGEFATEPVAVTQQRLKAKALQLHAAIGTAPDMSHVNPALLAKSLARDPRTFCRETAGQTLPPVTTWRWPDDAKREIMVPPGWALHVQCPRPFAVELCLGSRVLCHERSLPADDGSHFALLLPELAQKRARHQRCCLRVTAFDRDGCRRTEAPVLLLAIGANVTVRSSLSREEARQAESYALCTNGRGAMSQVRAAWATIRSQYDAILAANLHPCVPVDRRILVTRYRAWVVYRGYSQAVEQDCLTEFSVGADGCVRWAFVLSAGFGKTVRLTAELRLHRGRNAATVRFARERLDAAQTALADDEAVKLIVRPDIEDRNWHEKTKAYAGAEARWPNAVTPHATGFAFSPGSEHRLIVSARPGTFTTGPEWTYMVPHPVEVDRGLDGSSDLFSPGFFALTLEGGQHADLVAEALSSTGPVPDRDSDTADEAGTRVQESLMPHLKHAMRQFLVKRDNSLTVIAGYPWFLDWGRDTLIALRGYIAAGLVEEAREVLTQFARFEEQGTLPNMIRGNDDSNRDTSDAPLWFLVACADLLSAVPPGDRAPILDAPCGGRTLRQVALSVAHGYIEGTPNGISMDADTGLVFSPAHFTWMDTNHPTGTPREGYPIEIQALWHAGLIFLAQQDADPMWPELARKVRRSVRALYTQNAPGHLSDCLHAKSGVGARRAAPDDHLRPNQLLAICLGAVTAPKLCRRILCACEKLLVPGAIRSLADQPVRHALPVSHRGRALNDPMRPYWGDYRGDEDTRRKPAYHNGTAWTWLFPAYAEALCLAYGDQARDAALALLGSSTRLINRECVGHVPEIVDGNAPHVLRGCGAQAWGETELYRVLALLTRR